jgi:hypothetical protein
MSSNLFYSLINIAIAIFFLVLGLVAIMLPWSPMVRTDVIQFILEDSIAIFLFGFVFLIIGLVLVIYTLLSTRRSYYRLKGGPQSILIDEQVVQDYLDSYWKHLFPQAVVPNRLQIKKNKIHLVADLPYVPAAEQKQLLESIKADLTEMFSSFLGYKEPFYLSASFQPDTKPSREK